MQALDQMANDEPEPIDAAPSLLVVQFSSDEDPDSAEEDEVDSSL